LDQLTWTKASGFEGDHVVRRLPTWSWASSQCELYRGALNPFSVGAENVTPDLTVNEVNITTVDDDEMSEVISGRLQVIARLIPVYLLHVEPVHFGNECCSTIKLRDHRLWFWSDVSTDELMELRRELFGTFCTDWAIRQPGYCYYWINGLVLAPSPKAYGEYYRVGCFFSILRPS
jgi:hypothetical protein